MTFIVAKRIGYNMLKGWNTNDYPGWHWNTNQKENATQVAVKQDGDINCIFKIEFPQHRTELFYICVRS
jgi:hypothetical protein